MIFSWLRKRRRAKLLATPVPDVWREYLARHVPDYDLLTDIERERHLRDTRVFVAEKHWEGCRGLELTDEMRVAIAGQACLLVLGLDVDWFSRVLSVLVYPNQFMQPHRTPIGSNVALDGEEELLGLAHRGGAVVVSWADAREGGRHSTDADNVVLHEFAHQLDMRDGAADGTPPLASRDLVKRWRDVMTTEFARFQRRAEQGRERLLDEYGASSPVEFFAVLTETFFILPVELRRFYPAVYDVLREFYGQDPAGRRSG